MPPLRSNTLNGQTPLERLREYLHETDRVNATGGMVMREPIYILSDFLIETDRKTVTLPNPFTIFRGLYYDILRKDERRAIICEYGLAYFSWDHHDDELKSAKMQELVDFLYNVW